MGVFIYSVALASLWMYVLRYESLQAKVISFVLCLVLTNIPFLVGFSIVEWLDSVFARPSVFLLFLSLSVCFVSLCAPKEKVFSLKSKIFIFIFGFVLFLGALNLLWGFDIYALDFKNQLIIVAGVLFFAFMLDMYLGILYTLSVLVFLIVGDGVIFDYMIDVVVWLYAIVGIIGEFFNPKSRR